VQNKLLWAISQQTAAELIYRRVDDSLPLLGMQSYDKKNSTSIKKTDVSIAKNYLNENEIKLGAFGRTIPCICRNHGTRANPNVYEGLD